MTDAVQTKPNEPSNPVERPVRAGVFPDIDSAHAAVRMLKENGFLDEEITVICSDETKEQYFKRFEHQQPAGANTPAAATAGGAIGASLLGLSIAAVGLATGNIPLVFAGGAGAWTGAVWGGFIGAMMTRGFEKEAANFYDQAVQGGKIMISVEHKGPQAAARLEQAENLLRVAGAETVALPEG